MVDPISYKKVKELERKNIEIFKIYDGRIEEFEKDYAVLGENIIYNGDFNKGTDGWKSLSYGDIEVENNELIFTVTQPSTASRIEVSGNSFITNYFKNHKYFVSGEINSSSIASSYISFENQPIDQRLNKPNEWDRFKGLVIPREDGNTPFRFYHHTNEYVVGFKFKYRKLLVVDLTETFGKGNEPTQIQIERLLSQFPNSWFDGTKNLFLAKWALNELRRLDNEKANKKQEEWITPTLLNSWSSGNTTVRYMKDESGFVHLDGAVSGGTLETIAFQLPNGYKFTGNKHYVVESYGTPTGVVYIQNGSVYIKAGNILRISLFNVSFKAEN